MVYRNLTDNELARWIITQPEDQEAVAEAVTRFVKSDDVVAAQGAELERENERLEEEVTKLECRLEELEEEVTKLECRLEELEEL